jgi:hypothetical protein
MTTAPYAEGCYARCKSLPVDFIDELGGKMSYKSPIKLITDYEYKIKEELEENVIKAVCSYSINIDKDELCKLLLNERKQYEKGYADGKIDAVKHGHWIWMGEYDRECSCCLGIVDVINYRYCPNCGAKMDEGMNIGTGNV